jgi:hypothetical protein
MVDNVKRTRRTEARPDEFTAEERLTVTSIYGGEERNQNKTLSVRKFLVEPSYVRVGAGLTKNMGNYESLRVDVSITRPCYTEEEDDAIATVADKVSVFLEDEIKQYG